MMALTTHVSSAVDGVWDEWTAWGQCDVTCGPGEETRNRTCVEPLYGGADCDGDSTETRACDAGACLSKRHLYAGTIISLRDI